MLLFGVFVCGALPVIAIITLFSNLQRFALLSLFDVSIEAVVFSKLKVW